MKKARKKAPYDIFRDILIQWMHAPVDKEREICNHVSKGKTFIKKFKLQDKVKKNLKINSSPIGFFLVFRV